ncbi:N-acetyltransferase family 8 member 3 [Apis mellifera]|uniref:N-acetyltransferase family 8 member 3 n=1 Tax=Apis mellifera TaxID=7460 RepID=A0A7M7LKP2_APIME|nr:N-acetyltransferase family 8 member 3 [Apis mellifera]|eukprot:XP_001122051.1 N-acetyltransferase family 8 member 3 [Apis mellifera]
MSHIIVIRSYKPGDEINCKELVKAGVMSSLNSTFFGIVLKELTFQLMILFAAIMFIFFGLPLTVCLLVIPLVIFFVYVGTYIGFTAKAMEVNEEVSNIPRIYMSNAFSCFWIAEAFEPYLMTHSAKNVHYTIMTEQQFRNSNIDISSQVKKIVGTVALCKSHRLNKGAWIKRLYVHQLYRRKGIASCLINVAVQFAIDEGYSCANIVASEYTEGGRELCLKKGFELQQMYHKPILGSLITILMYELTYQIKPGEDDYVPTVYTRSMLNK